jgi:hypothetical protein
MKQTTIYTRPSVDVPWWTTIQPEEVKEYYKTTYADPGYRTGETFIESEDGLTLTHVADWNENASIFVNLMSMWLSDEVVNRWKEDRQRYCDSVGIVRQPTIMEWKDPETGADLSMITG